ncbi:receptor-type tyrosine-protein phosphatase N2 isoform X2 [Coccinella septempunctata]|uniref:receptor-type tyrosine-protein phosphatase N2 isoform X2 n=1 Tax=Coccinella septempunctata TaxID=41139 RepID=UPI001D08B4C4|nr:receptor-type tyrosine-protein phosphatase N2 isoform X2 [Coccinella septempunctata]
MPWPGIPLRIVLVLLAAFLKPPGVTSEGNVGCLFSNRLCLEDEWCFDDYAFGRCTPTGDVNEEDVFRFDLKRDELHELKRELQRLFALGYRWSHGYTQCRLQAMLYAMKHDTPFEEDVCSHLSDQDLEGALKAMDLQDPMDPREVAIIKYTPSVEKSHGKYADEVYYPPDVDLSGREALRNKILGSNPVDILDMPDPYADYQVMKRAWIPQMHRRSPPVITIKSTRDFDNDPLEFLQAPTFQEKIVADDNFREGMGSDVQQEGPRLLSFQDMMDIYPLIKYLNENYLSPSDLRRILSPDSYEQLERLLEDFDHTFARHDYRIADLEEQLAKENELTPERFSMTYNTPDKFREGWESRDSLEFINRRESQDADDEIWRSGPNEIFRELKKVQLPSRRNEEDEEGGYGGVFREQSKHGNERWTDVRKQHPSSSQRTGVYTEGGFVYPSDTMNDLKRKGFINDEHMYMPSMMKKGPRGAPHPNPYKGDQFDMEESNADYVFVGFNKNFDTWGQGEEVIRKIAFMLHLEPSSFENGHVIKNVVTFKVLPNSKGLNASEVAHRIRALKDIMSTEKGLTIIDAGIKDKEKMQAVLAAPMINDNEFYIVIFMVCGVLGAMIVAAALLIIIRKHIKSKEKLQGLSKPDTEASKDYQDLCRARMSAKGQPSGESVHGRITSLSKESEQSPSSRSSTSSWSEEPALHNMDISTGHIVLNYMEDHLKNKDRLEQEWVALCAYVAEPCATTVALRKENAGKNRYPDIVPYDHSRVILNELSNANGSDYINASSITDHDPRNPAYIATQGPLPHTSADFWQLIWEQGAVVIVMLTRLTESGVAMCHRYWPEEGSERYHIYEVHLVSEHIWCDDYLVRSFYLKNLRTGETRTVTQFHFLSWAETGVPASTKALLEFRRKVNKSYRGRSCPIVVHCSDGAGRTGTYCLIDMVLSRMAKGAKEIDIAATLEHLRDQRVKMVASKQQFEFVLTAVAEEVHAILKVLPPQPTAPQPDKEK